MEKLTGHGDGHGGHAHFDPVQKGLRWIPVKNNKVLKQIISVLCLRLRDSWIMLKVMSLSRSEDRIRTVLKLLAVQYGVKNGRGTIINIKLTHQDIADYASVSRETVTRYLIKLTKDGEIEMLDSKIICLVSPFL